MSLLSSRRFSACWWVHRFLTTPLEKLNLEYICNINPSLFSLKLFCRVEQHSRGRGAARWADGAGLLGPHQDSAAQPRGGGQLLRRGHPRTSDVTRRGSLDAQLWSSVLATGATGGESAKTTCATILHTIIFKSWFESFAFICLPSTLLLWSGPHPSVKWWPTGEIQHLYSHNKAEKIIHSWFLYSM